jgi:hypothetical protein
MIIQNSPFSADRSFLCLEPEAWEQLIEVITTISTASLGAVFVATAGMGLAASICLGTVVTVLSGFGGFVAVGISADLAKDGQDSKILFFVFTALAVVGAVVGFFAGGGALAATVAAFALVGTALALVMAVGCIGNLCKQTESP